MNNNNIENTQVRGEIVIYVEVSIKASGDILNKSILKKCPHCGQEGEKWFSRINARTGKTEIGISCKSCDQEWRLRFQNPFPQPFTQIDL